ncbi:MAG: transcriptional regulator [Chlorobiales bacterium]|nr:transcriptional regulator [Chlorobiales bacterium]
MSICTVTNQPITVNRNWETRNNGYSKVFKLLGEDILLYCIDADHNISLDRMDTDLLRSVLRDAHIESKPVCLVWDMKHITGMSLSYKKEIANLVYSSSLTFGIVILYNVEPQLLTIAETLAAMVPENLPVIIKQNYADAVTTVLDWKKGLPVKETFESAEEEKIEHRKREFLAFLGRLSWLSMTDQGISLPPRGDRMYPYFKAIDSLQNDLREHMKEKEQELMQAAEESEKTLAEKNILLNAQKELYKKLKGQLEKEKSALTARIATQEMELTRISTAIAEKTSALRELLDMISALDVDHQQKSIMVEHCRRMIDTEMIEKRLNIELTTTDSEFLSRLQRKHPNLNQRELRICLLIKLNYNTRDIARSVGISTRGMESIRYRMHKKIGLAKHQSLKGYLTELAILTN